MNSGIEIKPIKLKHAIHQDFSYEDLCSKIVAELQKIPSILEKHRMDPEISLLVCNIIECAIKSNKNLKIDKKNLAIEILEKIFNVTPAEKDAISKQIDFHINHDLVKAVSYASYFKGIFFSTPKNQVA